VSREAPLTDPNTPQARAFRGTDAKESPILLLSLGKLHLEAKTPQARASLERQITAANDEVDRFVFALYGLTEDDGKVVDVSIGEIGDDQD
jgi:hypothetical protein